MKMKDQDYTLNVLKMAINTDLDSSLGNSMSDLEALESNRDQLVWDIATRIYTQSGHRVELPMVRDLVEARIIEIKSQFVRQQHVRVRQHPPKKAQIGGEHQTQTGGDLASTRWIFLKICSVICGCTDVSGNRVSMSSQIYDLAEKHEVAKILMNLEETFEIRIPEETMAKLQTVEHIVDFISDTLQTGAKHTTPMSVVRHNRHQTGNEVLRIG